MDSMLTEDLRTDASRGACTPSGRWWLSAVAGVLLGCSSLWASAALASEDSQHTGSLRFEMTPLIGYRMGGSFTLSDTGQHVNIDDHGSFAVVLGLRSDEESQYELLYARQSTSLFSGATLPPAGVDIEYLHIGGSYIPDNDFAVRPFLSGGLGLTRFSPDPATARENTRPSASLGLGLRVPFNQHFALRLETRAFLTFVDPNTAFFCRSDQAGLLCRIHSRGSTFTQYDVLLGVGYTF